MGIDSSREKQKSHQVNLSFNHIQVTLTIIFVLIVAAVGIVLVMILPTKTAPIPTATTVIPTVTFPENPFINPNSIIYQALVPNTDGTSPSLCNFLTSDSKSLSFVNIGTQFKTVFFSTSTSIPAVIGGPNDVLPTQDTSLWTSLQSLVPNNLVLSSQTQWQKCTITNNASSCVIITWPNDSAIDKSFFLSSIWNNDPVMVSFQLDPALPIGLNYRCTIQSAITEFTNLSQVVSGLTAPLSDSITVLLYTTGQNYLSFVVVQPFTSSVSYFTYFTTTNQTPPQSINIEPADGNVVYADMTNDGNWMIVLSLSSLYLFKRNVQNGVIDFLQSDTLRLDNSTTVFSSCALSRINALTMWCCIATNKGFSMIISVDLSNGRFKTNTFKKVLSQKLKTTQGQATMIAFSSTPNMIVEIVSDTFGHQEITLFNQNLI